MTARVALVTDFGTCDSYVAEMKSRAEARVPGVQWLDVTHEIPAFGRLAAALAIERILPELPPGSALVAVVDPGVGTSRRGIIVVQRGVYLVGPDNGVLPSRDAESVRSMDESRWRTTGDRAVTFDGRELFAPLGAMLAAGLLPAFAGPEIASCTPSMLPDDALFVADGDRMRADGVVIAIDRYGNAVTNVRATDPAGRLEVLAPARFAGPLRGTYGDASEGAPLALIGSSGRLELAVREGSSGLSAGAIVEVALHRA